MALTAAILAGGRSARMGRDKAALPMGGATALETLVSRYQTAFGRALVSVDAAGRYPWAEEVADTRPGAGPLAGLEAAVRAAGGDVFLTAVDLPFGDAALARRLYALMGDAEVCVIRRARGGLEPVFAVYAYSGLPQISACLDENGRSFRDYFAKVKVREVLEEELPEWDLNRVLLNVNKPEDYEKALSYLK